MTTAGRPWIFSFPSHPCTLLAGMFGALLIEHLIISKAILQCATSLAATFDEQLIREAGEFLAEETKIKSSVILLAPTCNIQRSPLGGRAFESFSEDPHLSGMELIISQLTLTLKDCVFIRYASRCVCLWTPVQGCGRHHKTFCRE